MITNKMIWKCTRKVRNSEEWTHESNTDGSFETRSVLVPAHLPLNVKEAIIEAFASNNNNLSALGIYTKV